MVKTEEVRASVVLRDALDYLYGCAQSAETSAERDGFSLALALLGAARRGSSHPFTEAVFQCFGCSLEKHIWRRDERREFFAAEMRAVASNAAAAALAAHVSQPAWSNDQSDPASPRHDADGTIREDRPQQPSE